MEIGRRGTMSVEEETALCARGFLSSNHPVGDEKT